MKQEPVSLEALSNAPLNPSLHLQYAKESLRDNKLFLAYAELKSAIYLGARDEVSDTEFAKFKQALPDILTLDHNNFVRNKTLSEDILARCNGSTASILDIGGGYGQLAAFLPDNFDYCLVEPTMNGISGIDLPFEDKSFDYVVSCHVLEHIPLAERHEFMKQMLSKSRKGVILLNPFVIDGLHVYEGLELIIDVTNHPWAKEHVECTIPDLDYVRSFAEENGLQFEAVPAGDRASGMALVFVDYYARKANERENLTKINEFFNRHFSSIASTDKTHNSYLVFYGYA